MTRTDKAIQALLRLRRLLADGTKQALHAERHAQDAATEALAKLDQTITYEVALAEPGTLVAWRPAIAVRRAAFNQDLDIAQVRILAASEGMRKAALTLQLTERAIAVRRLQQSADAINRQQREIDDFSARYPMPGASTPRRN